METKDVPVCEFWVEGKPKPQPRPRAFAINGHARIYDAGTAEGWKSQIALAARQYIPKTPATGAMELRISFDFLRPKSHFRTGKLSHLLKPGVPDVPLGKPDLDNLAKAVMDCLTQLRFWADDSQIVSLNLSKQYAPEEGAYIRVTANAHADGRGTPR